MTSTTVSSYKSLYSIIMGIVESVCLRGDFCREDTADFLSGCSSEGVSEIVSREVFRWRSLEESSESCERKKIKAFQNGNI